MRTVSSLRRGRMHAGFVAFAVLASPPAARAQTDPPPADELWRQPGHWALQFRVGPDFTLNNLSGSVFSVQRWWNEVDALRCGVSLGFQSANQDVDQAPTQSDTSEQSLSLTTAYVRYLTAARQPVRAFIGTGPGMSYRRTHRADTGGGPVSESTTRAWRAGLDGTFGTEWRCLEWLTLLGEYLWAVEYQTQKHEATGAATARQEVIVFAGIGARLGLAAHF